MKKIFLIVLVSVFAGSCNSLREYRESKDSLNCMEYNSDEFIGMLCQDNLNRTVYARGFSLFLNGEILGAVEYYGKTDLLKHGIVMFVLNDTSFVDEVWYTRQGDIKSHVLKCEPLK